VPPKRLRELLWLPAVIELENQPRGEVFVPALYVNSHLHPNDSVKLGRMTEWNAVQEQIVTGSGQRVLLADDDEHALLSIRQLRIGNAVGQGAS
jgi:type VI secretion system protein ImpE